MSRPNNKKDNSTNNSKDDKDKNDNNNTDGNDKNNNNSKNSNDSYNNKPKPDQRQQKGGEKEPCKYHFKFGSCNKGASCQFRHDGPVPPELQRVENKKGGGGDNQQGGGGGEPPNKKAKLAKTVYEFLDEPSIQKLTEQVIPRTVSTFEKKLLVNALFGDDGLLVDEGLLLCREKHQYEWNEEKFRQKSGNVPPPPGGKIRDIFILMDRPTKDGVLSSSDFSDSLPRLNAQKQAVLRGILNEMDTNANGTVDEIEFECHFLRKALEAKPVDEKGKPNPKLFQYSDDMLDLLNICRGSMHDVLAKTVNTKIAEYDLKGIIDPVE